MKKMYAVFIIFVALVVATAVWYSPFAGRDGVKAYENNVPVHDITGLCYGADETVRMDFAGGEAEVAAALKDICARTVKIAAVDGLTVIYAYSPRVCAKPLFTSDGDKYNVMAAYGGGSAAVGAPILQGAY